MSRVFLFREARKAGAARKEYSKAFVHLELPTIAESPRSLKETENIILVQKEEWTIQVLTGLCDVAATCQILG